MAPHLVLAGGGHAHLFVLEALARGRFPAGVNVTLVASARHHVYSGMLPGYVGGRYRLDEIRLDLADIARAAGAKFIESPVAGIMPADRAIRLQDGRGLAYDVLSLAIGSDTAGADLPGVQDLALTVKPIDGAPDIVNGLERAVSVTSDLGPRVAVVGAGAGGIELALNIRARLRGLDRPQAPVTVVGADVQILRDRSEACRRAAAGALAAHGVATVLGTGVARVDRGGVALADGRTVGADMTVWATGPAAPALLRGAGLALDEGGYLRVDPWLRSISHPEIFAAGDVASLEAHPRPAKSGVYAVREGPVLRDNLAAVLGGGQSRRRFRPQPRFLALLNTGDGRAICSYGRFAAMGRWAMSLKHRIDLAFMRRFGCLAR